MRACLIEVAEVEVVEVEVVEVGCGDHWTRALLLQARIDQDQDQDS